MKRRDLLKAFLAANPVVAQAAHMASNYGLPFTELSKGTDVVPQMPPCVFKKDKVYTSIFRYRFVDEEFITEIKHQWWVE